MKRNSTQPSQEISSEHLIHTGFHVVGQKSGWQRMLKANKFLDLMRKVTRDLQPVSISVRLNGPAVINRRARKVFSGRPNKRKKRTLLKLGQIEDYIAHFIFLFFSLLCLSTLSCFAARS